MKLLVLSLLVITVAVVHSQKKRPFTLLGADDVEEKTPENGPKSLPVPQNLKEIKKLARDDRMKLREMHSRIKALKTQKVDKSKSKSERKTLKREFKKLKKDARDKKSELTNLKKEMKVAVLKAKQTTHSGNKKDSRNGFDAKERLLMEERKELARLLYLTTEKPTPRPTLKPTTTIAAPTTTIEPITAAALESNKKSSRRKSQRKNEKKSNKRNRNKNKDLTNRMQSDQPVIFPSRNHKKTPCNVDTDCHAVGTKCIANKRGRKHCRFPHGKGKPAGKKCHSSEQCSTGLKCFVTKTTEQEHHKKHPRRGKGTCADPATTDASKGKFLPLNAELKL